MMRVSICILSFNRKAKLFTSLLKLREELDYPRAQLELIVVDNGSSDGSADMVADLFPEVKLIRLPSNIGIGAWNESFKVAKGEACMVLDDDAYIEGEDLKRSVAYLKAHPKVGVVALRPLNPETGVDFHHAYPTGKMSFWGCCALIRKEVVDALKGYDGSFFFQCFELDFTLRMRALGWDVAFPEGLRGYHMTQVDPGTNPWKFYVSRRNLMYVLMKHFSGPELVRALAHVAQITWRYGQAFPKRMTIKAIGVGLLKGALKRREPIPKELQREYLENFGEFLAPEQQLQIWPDPERQFWKDRAELYPNLGRKVEARPEALPSLVIFLHRLNIDGASLIALRVLEDPEFRAHFSKITVVSNFHGDLEADVRATGVQVKVFPFERLEKSPNDNANAAFRDELQRLLREHDTAWLNTLDHPAELMELLHQSGKRGLVFGHESLAIDSPVLEHVRLDDRKRLALQRLAEGGKVAVTFPSTDTVAHAQRRLKTKKIHLQPYGIERSELVSRYDDLDRVRFLVTGWFGRRKNQRIAAPLFAELYDKTLADPAKYRDWEVTFVGTHFSQPEYSSFIEEALSVLPPSRVGFYPMMPNAEIRKLMAQSHFVLIPSLGEALCVSAMEMMSSGGLVVSSDCEGARDLISSTVDGFVYEKQNFAQLARMVEKVVRRDGVQSAELVKMGKAAQAKMRTRFSMEQYREGIARLLVGERPRNVLRELPERAERPATKSRVNGRREAQA